MTLEELTRAAPHVLDYPHYLDWVEVFSRTPVTATTDDATNLRLATTRLNAQRMERIGRTYAPSDDVRRVLLGIREHQLWVVLSEPWCGDSAQCLPPLAAIAGLSPLITFRVILRDENPGIMDLYLTNGTRSIPKLIAFSAEGIERFRWGPRPAEAQALFLQAVGEGVSREEKLRRLHLWYARNCGSAIGEEIASLAGG